MLFFNQNIPCSSLYSGCGVDPLSTSTTRGCARLQQRGRFWYSKQRTIHLSESDWPSPSSGSFVQGCVPIALYLNTLGISRRSLSLFDSTQMWIKNISGRGGDAEYFLYSVRQKVPSLSNAIWGAVLLLHIQGDLYTYIRLCYWRR